MKMSLNVASSETLEQRNRLSQNVRSYKTDVAVGGCVQHVMSLTDSVMTSSAANVAIE